MGGTGIRLMIKMVILMDLRFLALTLGLLSAYCSASCCVWYGALCVM